MMTKNSPKIKIIKGFVTQRNGKTVTIFDAEKSMLYTFNPSATFIFERLKKGLDANKIASLMMKEFNIQEKKAIDDINDFIKTLLSKGLAKKEKLAK